MDIVLKLIYTKYQNTIVVNVQNRDDFILVRFFQLKPLNYDTDNYI